MPNAHSNRPQARDDSAATAEDVSLSIDVLANDGRGAVRIWSLDQSDPANPSTFAELEGGSTVGIGTNGELLYKTAGKFDYLAEGETATDSFTYSVRAGSGPISTATVTILVTGTNDPAVLSETRVKLKEGDDASDISTSGSVFIYDVDGPETFVASTQAGQYGLFAIDEQGEWTYQADGPHDEFKDGKTYTEIFTVEASDGTTSTVTIDIVGTADSPAMLGADLAAFA
jgi:VCBS repeat-containing protein